MADDAKKGQEGQPLKGKGTDEQRPMEGRSQTFLGDVAATAGPPSELHPRVSEADSRVDEMATKLPTSAPTMVVGVPPVPSPEHYTHSRQKLTEEKLALMSKPEILAVAHDRGYKIAAGGRGNITRRFLAEQEEDESDDLHDVPKAKDAQGEATILPEVKPQGRNVVSEEQAAKDKAKAAEENVKAAKKAAEDAEKAKKAGPTKA